MTTFDYAAAWRSVARPAFNSLPANVRELVARVADEAGPLSQLRDCSMPWPEDSDLRERFDKVPAEWLALAARAVYSVGHWWPRYGRGVELPGRESGAAWKFAHYADQSLRARLSIPTGDEPSGVSYRLIEGAIRICYSSREMWTWAEVAPGTAAGYEHARACGRRLAATLDNHNPKTREGREARDSAAYAAMEAIKADRSGFAGGSASWPALMDLERFMVEEGDQEPDPDLPPVDVPAVRAAKLAALREDYAKRIAKLETERDGRAWWLARDIPTDDLIYYDHIQLWVFGWRDDRKIGPVLLSRILDVISEFPGAYRIETTDKRKLEGGRQ